MDDATTTRLLEAERLLAERFDHAGWRPGQREVIAALLAGRDVVAVMPTGAGKSLCYQLPALVLGGLTLVVSPLIALMKDQVDALSARGIAAGCIHSAQAVEDQAATLAAARSGLLRLLFVAPERFRGASFLAALDGLRLALFAVDEAHCISQWGFDFRPDYRRLGQVRRRLGEPLTVALTATATPQVRMDIAEQLGLEQPQMHVRGFERENLHLEVLRCVDRDAKLDAIGALLDELAGAVLVYCATRRDTEEVARALQRRGHDRVAVYHAGLGDAARAAAHERFMRGEVRVLVATLAFGMGVDKADVRAVLHFGLPRSLEGYYQEIGRAGRDGAPARCVLLYNFADTAVHDFFVRNTHPSRELVEAVYEVLVGYGGARGQLVEMTARGIAGCLELRTATGRRRQVHPLAIESALRLLGESGHVEPLGTSGWLVVAPVVAARALAVDHDALARRLDDELERLKRVVYYATSERCRTHDILGYFGCAEARRDGHCGHCDACEARLDSCATPEQLARREARHGLARRAARAPQRRLRSQEPRRVVVLKILSCVARLDGEHGAETAVAVLCGHRTETVATHGLDRLSTWRLLGYLRWREVGALVRGLLERGLLALDTAACVRLTARGARIMTDPQAELPDAVEHWLGELFPRPAAAEHAWRPTGD